MERRRESLGERGMEGRRKSSKKEEGKDRENQGGCMKEGEKGEKGQ